MAENIGILIKSPVMGFNRTRSVVAVLILSKRRTDMTATSGGSLYVVRTPKSFPINLDDWFTVHRSINLGLYPA